MTGSSLSASLKTTGKVGCQSCTEYELEKASHWKSCLDIYLTNSDKASPCKIPRIEPENRKWLSLPTVDKSLPFDKEKNKLTLFLLSSNNSKYHQKRYHT